MKRSTQVILVLIGAAGVTAAGCRPDGAEPPTGTTPYSTNATTRATSRTPWYYFGGRGSSWSSFRSGSSSGGFFSSHSSTTRGGFGSSAHSSGS